MSKIETPIRLGGTFDPRARREAPVSSNIAPSAGYASSQPQTFQNYRELLRPVNPGTRAVNRRRLRQGASSDMHFARASTRPMGYGFKELLGGRFRPFECDRFHSGTATRIKTPARGRLRKGVPGAPAFLGAYISDDRGSLPDSEIPKELRLATFAAAHAAHSHCSMS